MVTPRIFIFFNAKFKTEIEKLYVIVQVVNVDTHIKALRAPGHTHTSKLTHAVSVICVRKHDIKQQHFV